MFHWQVRAIAIADAFFSKLIIHKCVHAACHHRRSMAQNVKEKKKTKKRFQLWISFTYK